MVRAGSTHSDEMCNLYMMMWSELPVFFNCYDGPVSFQRHGPGLPLPLVHLPQILRYVLSAFFFPHIFSLFLTNFPTY